MELRQTPLPVDGEADEQADVGVVGGVASVDSTLLTLEDLVMLVLVFDDLTNDLREVTDMLASVEGQHSSSSSSASSAADSSVTLLVGLAVVSTMGMATRDKSSAVGLLAGDLLASVSDETTLRGDEAHTTRVSVFVCDESLMMTLRFGCADVTVAAFGAGGGGGGGGVVDALLESLMEAKWLEGLDAVNTIVEYFLTSGVRSLFVVVVALCGCR